jgi:hypothetical protein
MTSAKAFVTIVATLLSTPAPAWGQGGGPPSPEQIARMRTIGQTRATLGTSGLRRFLSESASLGEAQNRAASYRMIEQVERARRAELEGRITAIESALQDPTLPADERTRLQAIVDESQAALTSPPAYRANYHTSTGQAGSLVELGFLGVHPLFLFTKGRVAWRTDPDGYLRVASGRIDLAPTLFLTPTVFASAGLAASLTDVDVLAFDGTSESASLGVRFDLGAALSRHWAVGLHVSHSWSAGRVVVVRPGPQPVAIESEPSTLVTAAKVEIMGRYTGADALVPDFLEITPRLGAYGLRTSYDSVTNSLGQTAAGLFGSSDALVILAAGVAVGVDVGSRVTPDVYLGVDHELPGALSNVMSDRTGVILGAGLTCLLTRSARLGLSFTHARSTGDHRRSNELDLVAVLDF